MIPLVFGNKHVLQGWDQLLLLEEKSGICPVLPTIGNYVTKTYLEVR